MNLTRDQVVETTVALLREMRRARPLVHNIANYVAMDVAANALLAIGAYPAFDLARTLDPRLVGDDLAGSLRAALDAPRPDYAARAADLLSAFSHEAMDRVLARDVLPRLLPAWEPR